jgi:hypothetical protein
MPYPENFDRHFVAKAIILTKRGEVTYSSLVDLGESQGKDQLRDQALSEDVTPPSSDDEKDIDRLWQWVAHEDSILASRVSFFLVAQSILVAVTASLVNSVANLSHAAETSLRREVFGLAVAINVIGVILTAVFWYVLWMNFLSVGASMDELTSVMNRRSADNIRARVWATRYRRRNDNWIYRVIFRKKGMNWMVTNVLPVTILTLWCIVGAFSIVIFVSH